MSVKRVLWLEDRFPEFHNVFGEMLRAGILFDPVTTVTAAVERMRAGSYTKYIFDLIVPPGSDGRWSELYRKNRIAGNEDLYLGLELLRSIFAPGEAIVELSPPIEIDPKKVIVFTNVFDKKRELLGFGIPAGNIIMKSDRVEALSEIMKETEYMHGKFFLSFGGDCWA